MLSTGHSPHKRTEGWLLRHTTPGDGRDDTLFALANGSLGVRGGVEEASPTGDGCFLAGVYEQHPIHYHERFPGFARGTDTRVPVPDGRPIAVFVDGTRLDIDACEIDDFERTLDLASGRLLRSMLVRTPGGITLAIASERFVAFDQDLLAIRFTVTAVDSACTITLEPAIEAGRKAVALGDDPRIGTAAGDALEVVAHSADAVGAMLAQATQRSGIAVCCAQSFAGIGTEGAVEGFTTGHRVAQRVTARLQPGQTCGVDKFVAYAVGPSPQGVDGLHARTRAMLEVARTAGYEALEEAHASHMATFWSSASVDVSGDQESQLALRFNLFHLLQSAARDGIHGTAAKGLTGEGYEGHCFWDTEAFVLPVMVFTAPAVARAMLLYRYRMLDAARANARELDHARGALYPWRTIAGGECSGHYPTGSAAYHINAAIAYAIGLYLDATGDGAFLAEAGAEMLFETARIWPQAGAFDALRGGGFGIHGVTGPDEYSVLVDNNFYTNRMAQRHLLRAVDAWDQLSRTQPAELAALSARIGLDAAEIAQWKRIADAMLLPVDAHLDIYAQDDTFLHKPRWPYADDATGRPLLLHYHPITLYRHQISKQADLVMALFLAGDGLDPACKRRSFEYYETVTTHDSTLSAAVHGIVASDVGHPEKAFRYFQEALRVDLDDLHGNTSHGVHMAAMAGSWLGLACGFGGMRVVDGTLHFAPTLPEGWQSYAFRLQWHGRQLHVAMGREGARYTLGDGAPLRIRHDGADLLVSPTKDSEHPHAPADTPFPGRFQALIFDLDGVLTDTAHVHYRAWKGLADAIGVPFDRHDNERMKGLSRMASLEVLLERSTTGYDDATKADFAERKNRHYMEAIATFGPHDLFEGVAALLDTARSAGLKLGLASASRNAPALVQRLGIADRFDYIADMGKIANAKPAPDIFLDVAAHLGVPPSACLGIEDSAAGIAAIRAAGMASVGIGEPAALAAADAVVPSLSSFQIDQFVLR